ncbi:MAG: TonB-dependent receptor plug domain-containing protein [Flavobacteriia bacterium]|nr:TonB-dependent receptor plug domain-containing protein [Flavobacteriia bacterium]
MLRKLKFGLVSVLLTMTYAYSQTGLGTIKGVIKDEKTKQPIFGCKVLLKQNNTIKGGANTDFDGKFQINSIAAGEYDVEVRNEGEGYQAALTTGVVVNGDKITFLDDLTLAKASSVKEIEEVVVVAYKVPLINKDGGASGSTITREDIARLPARSATGVASTVGGVNVQEGSGDISIRGSRSDDTYFYIDGIKVRGSSNLPKSAIEEVSVITGGLPANYGDATGGIISVTTRGPSSKFFGSVEAVSSGFYFKGKDELGYDGKVYGLDKYGYNLVEGMLSGPLWMQKDSTGRKTKPRLGFLVSLNFTDQLDDRPLSGGSYRVKKEVREELINNPLVRVADVPLSSANYLRKDDFELVKWRMNARQKTISASGKIDVNTGPSVNLSFGGSLNYDNGTIYNRSNSLLNFTNFGFDERIDWRVYGRLTQRFTNDKEGSSSKIKSAFYTLNVDFSKQNIKQYDKDHKYNLFNYGHVGYFDIQQETMYTTGFYTDPRNASFQFTEFKFQEAIPTDVSVTYTPSDINPELAAITTQYFNIFSDREPAGVYENLFQIQQGNALRNGDLPSSVYSIWSNIGAPYNGFLKRDNSQFRITGSGSVNIGDHSISLGFEYEKRTDRGFENGTNTNGNDNGPTGLWTTARQLANKHIAELDTSKPYVFYRGTIPHIRYERLNSGYAYQSGTGNYGGYNDDQSFFDYNLREKLGYNVAGNDFVNIDALDPNMFSLDMFTPDELFNSGNSYVSYWGYDHTGKKVKGNTDINKYFNELDENGNYVRKIGAFQPVYVSGYIMDKFAFKDIVFNVGVRVDAFNANQPVLKDKYLLYEANTVKEAKDLVSKNPNSYSWVNIPTSMEDDYVVYVDNVENPTQINGFRKEDIWYDKNGIEIENAQTIAGSNGIAPWLLDPDLAATGKISEKAFEDYKTQINVMPRVAFSFPISDEASFFAHYDILTKRPTSGFRFDPFEYQFIRERSSSIFSNPNLKPETTIDYELGFQQVLGKTSAIKISAFYREQRNQVQLINVFQAYPVTYKTYGNRDFGTVKGLTISYDLRQTGNFRMTANYTLQFAEGTGSDATSQQGIINAGLPNFRSIFPYDYDQRHAINISADYRYGEGEEYNGPSIAGVKLFENTGINLITNIYSGSPYSNQTEISNEGVFSPLSFGLTGTRNGSRLPWQYRLDLQVDRSFTLKMGKDENKKKETFLNVYIRVTNLFNQLNIIDVYRATGNWDDDGYLAAAQYQNAIQNQLDEQSFRDYYQMKIQNPYNISIPRTIRLGLKFDF